MKFIILAISISFLIGCKSKEEEPSRKSSNKVSVSKQPVSNGIEVIDVQKGNVHYVIFKSSSNIEVVNYTSDSIEYEISK